MGVLPLLVTYNDGCWMEVVNGGGNEVCLQRRSDQMKTRKSTKGLGRRLNIQHPQQSYRDPMGLGQPRSAPSVQEAAAMCMADIMGTCCPSLEGTVRQLELLESSCNPPSLLSSLK